MSLLNDARMDKTALTVASLHEPSDENDYWHRQTPEARLAALELMRQVVVWLRSFYRPTSKTSYSYSARINMTLFPGLEIQGF